MERNGIHIINLYKTAAKIEAKAKKKSLHQVKNTIRSYKKSKQKTSLLKSKHLHY
jgi:hypothetical protein